MKKAILSFAILSVLAITVSSFITPPTKTIRPVQKQNPAVEAGKWSVDKAHSKVSFTVTHLVITEVEGSFKLFDGTMENTQPDLSDARVAFSVDINSVNTDNDMRDNDLKSDHFFNAQKFPTMKFQSTSMKPLGGNKYELKGTLTIKDVTKPVTFDVNYGGTANAMGTTKLGFKAKTTINRFDYNLKWSQATETGGLVVGKDVDIVVNVELNKSKE